MKISEICPDTLKKYVYNFIFFTHKILRSKYFIFEGEKISYENSYYNYSFTNERSVEIPLVKYLLKKQRSGKILEIGNVLNHYNYDTPRDIVDKYEVCMGVINEDIENYMPQKKYDLIISVSTLEHVGFDEGEKLKDSEKFGRCISHILKNLLSEQGVFIVTLPVNYNHHVDDMIFNSDLFQEKFYMVKENLLLNTWSKLNYEDMDNKIRIKPFLVEEVFFGICTKS